MLSTKRHAAVLSSLLLCLATPLALAADHSAKVDPKDCGKPDYPVRWQNEGDSGEVIVAFLIGADGKVMESKVVESSGYQRVDRASVRAGARCTFQPGAGGTASWAKVKYAWIVD